MSLHAIWRQARKRLRLAWAVLVYDHGGEVVESEVDAPIVERQVKTPPGVWVPWWMRNNLDIRPTDYDAIGIWREGDEKPTFVCTREWLLANIGKSAFRLWWQPLPHALRETPLDLDDPDVVFAPIPARRH